MKRELPLLSFDFASEGKETHTFRNPVKIIIAQKIEDVLPSFDLIQEAIDQGYYAAGYISYESAPAFDPAFNVHPLPKMPLLWFGIYKDVQHDHLLSTGEFYHSDWLPNITYEQYEKDIARIKQAIENGETYQTNHTIRLHSEFHGDDISYYTQLKKAQNANYSAYLNIGDFTILSASPELFFQLKDSTIHTRPMKGTIARGNTFEEDEENAKLLYESEKNRAENVMIVDLLRNDLSIIAETGSVKVPKLFTIEQYPTVHQMTSTVTAQLKENTSLFHIFKALFPCGSITGAPKISTMDLISELEQEPRDVYCGAIGFITPNKEAIFNVPIRTVLIDHQTRKATYGVGGGITWDSTCQDEYEEILAKAKFLKEQIPSYQLLETILLENGKLYLLEEHLNRLQKSASYFKIHLDVVKVKETLTSFIQPYSVGKYKIRLLIDKSGKVALEAHPLTSFNESIEIAIATKPIDKNNPFLYHKTTNRGIYKDYLTNHPDVFDVLLWNEDKELTEFCNGNIVLEIEGNYYTPPITSGLLAGTFREKLLKEQKIVEKVLTLDHLEQCSNIYFINSVRKWMKVTSIIKK